MEPAAEPGPDGAREPVTGSPYEIFVVAVSVLSLINIVLFALPLQVLDRGIIAVVDGVLCIFLLADFVQRLVRSDPPRDYFFHHLGWLDLLGSIPVPGLRLFRIVRTVRLVRELRRKGGRRMVREISAGRAEASLLLAVFIAIVTIEFSAMAVLSIESRTAGSNITSTSDALWWAWVTMTTVGYGDVYPVSNPGRVVGAFLMTMGLGLFGVFTAFIANLFLAPRVRRMDSPSSEITEMRALLDQNDRLAMELRSRLDRVEGSMRPKRQR